MAIMTARRLAPLELRYCHRTISSDALAAIVLHHIATARPMSVTRFADGEFAVFEAGLNGRRHDSLMSPEWISKYGMTGADMSVIAKSLVTAAQHSTYVAPSISGLYLPAYNVYSYMPDNAVFVDTFYMYFWKASDRVAEILAPVSKLFIINRNWEALGSALVKKYGLKASVAGFALDNWRQISDACNAAVTAKPGLVLVSGGPPGKILTSMITEQWNCVALDVGCAIDTWV